MNKVFISGRLTKDPVVRTVSNDLMVANYTLAVDRKGKSKEADFIQCVGYGKTAEFIQKYLHQGTKMIVSGHIQTGSYKNKDGNTVYTTNVVIDEQEFAESKKAAGQDDSREDGFINFTQ